jgi:hypothetical protein
MELERLAGHFSPARACCLLCACSCTSLYHGTNGTVQLYKKYQVPWYYELVLSSCALCTLWDELAEDPLQFPRDNLK